MSSIRGLGTPWNYNQTFTGAYHAPFNRISFLDYLSGNLTYSSTYQWDKGATVEDLYLGNSIQNQSYWNADARLNFETLYNKSKLLQAINRRFARTNPNNTRNNKNTPVNRNRPKQIERAVTLSPDTSTIFRHNLKTKNLKLSATENGKAINLESKILDENTVEILNRSESSIILRATEIKKETKNSVVKDVGEYALRFIMMPRSLTFRWRKTHSLMLPQFSPNVGDIFGQSNRYGNGLAPGLDFAFGFYDEKYIDKALRKDWLLTGKDMTSPAIWNKGSEFNFELILEPIRGLRIVLTSNHTDNRTQQVQFMYENMPKSLSGSYVRTHVALASALKNSKASDGYYSSAFNKFLNFIPIISQRVEAQYLNSRYPDSGFLKDSPIANTPFNPMEGGVLPTSPDVLIPAFIAAYSGYNPDKITLSHFPGLSSMRPNWRVTYDGFLQLGNMAKYFKAFTLTHAYQCTYSIGNYSSYLNWVGISDNLGFIQDELTQTAVPSTPYNISSVAITERFAPLVGVNLTLYNDISINAEYRDARTINLNSSAGQVVETSSKQISLGAGWKIAEFNKVIKFGGKQTGISNDLSLNLDFTFSRNQALIRRIETAYTQATTGTQTLSINFMASYQISRRITLSAFFDHMVNNPLVSNHSYPTTNSNYGIAVNLSLAR